MLLNYTKRFQGFYNRMTKHITRSAMIDPDLIHRGMSTDFWHYWNGIANFRDLKLVNVLGEDMHAYYDDAEATDRMLAEPGRFEAYLERAMLNHYVYKSREDFLIRARRGTNSVFAQQAWYEQAYHSGQVDQIMDRLNQVEDRLLADRWQAVLAGGAARNVFAPETAPLISQGKMAMQSSVCEHSRAPTLSKDAAGAVDGVIDGDYSFHTDTEDAPWWLVDLEGLHEIAEIRLFNRVDWRTLAARANRIRIEISDLGADWVEVFRKDDELVFGGADGDPLIWRASAPVRARYVRVSLLQRNPLHLDQVQVFGHYVGPEADRPLDEPETKDVPTAPVDERAVLERFQSLGNTCEFGQVQKNAGVGGLGLLRWSATSPASLMLGLADDFRLMGEPDNVELTDHKGEYFWTDRTYFMHSHTFIRIEGSDRAKVLEELTARSRFLRRKFAEDLRSGEPIWVFHVHKDYDQATEEAVRRLAEALAARGPNLLFWVVPAFSAGRAPGTAEWIGPNLLKGYGGLHAALDSKPLSARAEWLKLCKAALALIDAQGSPVTAPAMLIAPSADVTGPVNLARGKPAMQSSISPWSRRPDPAEDAAGAVDGRITGEAKFHTDFEDQPWWQVDLGDVFDISAVKIYNRMDDPHTVGRSSDFAIEIGVVDDRMVEIFRRFGQEPFGGIDGNPFEFRPRSPLPARFVKIKLLRREHLHLDQVEVFGDIHRPDTRFDALTTVASERASPAAAQIIARMTDADMIGHFQSLGDNCEFGFVTRSLGSERLQLLQWSSIKPGQLLEMLLRKFEGYAEPGKMTIELGEPLERPEFWVRDHAYGSVGHTWIFEDTERAEGFEQAHIQRLRFLRNKFLEDLEDGSHILVYRSASDIPLPFMRDLIGAIRALGPSVLFWISLADESGRQPGDIEWVDQFLLRGYIDQFAPDNAVYEGKVDMWIRLCRRALEAVAARYPGSPVVAEITGSMVSSRFDKGLNKSAIPVSFGKPTSQSSLSRWSIGNTPETDAAGAVSGGINGRASFHTDLDDSPWWWVDLGLAVGISEVRIYNRVDDPSTMGRSSHLAIDVGLQGDDWVEIYRREDDVPFGGVDGHPLVFTPPIPVPGRFVRVRLLRRDYLHLDQVEVFGEPLPGWA